MSLWNHFADPIFDGVGLVSIKSKATAILLPVAIFVFSSFPFSSYFPWVGGAANFGLIWYQSLSPGLALPTF